MRRDGTIWKMLIAFALQATMTGAAAAEVRFGKNVRIGGHDVSNQTFDKNRRGEYYIYNETPPNSGCTWRTNAGGSRTKVCHLKRKTP
jgi:hypothetical protein